MRDSEQSLPAPGQTFTELLDEQDHEALLPVRKFKGYDYDELENLAEQKIRLPERVMALARLAVAHGYNFLLKHS